MWELGAQCRGDGGKGEPGQSTELKKDEEAENREFRLGTERKQLEQMNY